jgi:predicted metal-dependent HD superfamily phosphohydrolase
MNSKELWQRFAQQIGISDRELDASFRALTKRYSLPRRYYHTLDGHVVRCIELFQDVHYVAINPLAVEGALWLHDAYYNPGTYDNEKRSGIWAQSFLRQFGARDEQLIDQIVRLIAATTHTGELIGSDEQLVMDIDLAILGAPQNDFDKYEVCIRNEYAWVPWLTFAEKRKEILKKFLARPTIYHHRIFVERYERMARKNLIRSIKQLRKSQEYQSSKAQE